MIKGMPSYEPIEKLIDDILMESYIPKYICENEFDQLMNNEKDKYRILPKTKLEKKLEDKLALTNEVERMVEGVVLDNLINIVSEVNREFVGRLIKKDIKR